MGLLLNVDYGDPLARARGRAVLAASGARAVGLEEAVDAFYIHYRRPIFGPVDGQWGRFVSFYVSTRYYEALSRMCRLNHRASREAAARLLKAYEAALPMRGMGAEARALEALRRQFGDPGDLERLYVSLRRLGDLLTRGRRGDPAAMAMAVPDRRRARLAEMLAKVVELAMAMEGDGAGGVWGEEVELRPGRLEGLTAGARALYHGAYPVFLHRLATGTLPSRRLVGTRELDRLYILLDKSGSMYGRLEGTGLEKIAAAAAYVIALWRRAERAVVRLFDAEVYPPVEDAGALAQLLLRVTAAGGTDISRAVERAAEEAPRGYGLVVVTDGEDDLHPHAVKRAWERFRRVRLVLVGGGKAPAGVPAVRLRVPETAARLA